MIMYKIGIDVGLEGAFSIFDSENKLAEIIKTPIVKITIGAYKRWYDIKEIISIFKTYSPAKILIEYQRPMSGQGITSTFRLGRGFGLIEGLAYSIIENEILIIDPKKWQNYFAKKYLTSEEIKCFVKKTKDMDTIKEKIKQPEVKEWFEHYIELKSMSLSKAKSFFIYYRIMQKNNTLLNMDNKIDHNAIDAYLIGLYCCEN